MSEKRVAPLNNPPSEKSVVDAVPGNKNTGTTIATRDMSRESLRGERKGRVSFAEALTKCQMCGRVQKVVFGIGKMPEWHRCIWCRELQPMDGYLMIAYGLRLPRTLAPHEVEARRARVGY